MTLSILVLFVSVYFLSNHLWLNENDYGNRFGYSLAIFIAIFSFTISFFYKKTLSKTTTFFGNISYSFYLVHQVLGYFLIDLLIDLNMPIPQIITFVIITLVAYAINKYIEVPSNNYGHEYVKK